MKKLFIAASLLIGMIAGAMVLSSFSEPKKNEKTTCLQLIFKTPTYWEGHARRANNPNAATLYIKVYQSEGQCNSYYAVTTDNGYEEQMWVKENPDYVPRSSKIGQYKYYVTWHNQDYYFNM